MTATNKCYNFVGFRYSPPLKEIFESLLVSAQRKYLTLSLYLISLKEIFDSLLVSAQRKYLTLSLYQISLKEIFDSLLVSDQLKGNI